MDKETRIKPDEALHDAMAKFPNTMRHLHKVDLGELASVRQAIDWTVKNCPNAPYVPVKREVLESLEAKLHMAREDERDLRRALTAVVLAAGGHVIVRDDELYDLPKAVLTVTEVRAAPLDQCGYHYAVELSQ